MKEHHKTLEAHSTFKEWRKDNKDHTFVHAFLMDHPGMQRNWQFGYYNPHTDRLTTFVLEDDNSITHKQDEEAFKDPDKKILPVTLSAVDMTYDQAIAIAKGEAEKLASGQPITTSIAILQHIAEVGTVWNVTLITFAFNRINVKIDAKTGEIKKSDMESLMNLGSKA